MQGWKQDEKRAQSDNRISLKKVLLVIVVMCWILPVILITSILAGSYRVGMTQKTRELLSDKIQNSALLMNMNINKKIEDSKKVSYDKVIENFWRAYENGRITKADFFREITAILNTNYGQDKSYHMALLYLTEEPEMLYMNKSAERERLDENVLCEIQKIAELDTSGAFLKMIDGKFYIIRNLYATLGYIKYGVLALEVNKELLLNINPPSMMYEMIYSIDGEGVIGEQGEYKQEQLEIIEAAFEKAQKPYTEVPELIYTDTKKSNYEGYLFQTKNKEFHLRTLMLVNKNEIYPETALLNQILVILNFVLIPVIVFMLYFIRKQVTMPIHELEETARKMERDNIGVQIANDKHNMPNKEFASLAQSFNRMSAHMKYLFDYAYKEELARKDAQILALQSQINPHFLNNTLEMMNWQARMSGDVQISKMIEALSVLLNAGMDRSNKRLGSLAEELQCADAYCYIISKRFGQRLNVQKNIDSSLLQVQVPSLIIQPILENAVHHGIEKVNKGTIWLDIFREEEDLVIEIKNTGGELSGEDEKRVAAILNGEQQSENRTSLGIRNVNERLKLIFGEEYGISFSIIEEKIADFILRIPIKENG